MRGPKYIQGYFNMGRPRVPPLPQNIVMVGRDDGLSYWLTHTGTVGTLSISLSTSLPSGYDSVTYGPFAGPYLNGTVRLYVSGATLTAETVDISQARYYTQRVLTRRGKERTFLEVTVPVTWQEGDALVYTELTI